MNWFKWKTNILWFCNPEEMCIDDESASSTSSLQPKIQKTLVYQLIIEMLKQSLCRFSWRIHNHYLHHIFVHLKKKLINLTTSDFCIAVNVNNFLCVWNNAKLYTVKLLSQDVVCLIQWVAPVVILEMNYFAFLIQFC